MYDRALIALKINEKSTTEVTIAPTTDGVPPNRNPSKFILKPGWGNPSDKTDARYAMEIRGSGINVKVYKAKAIDEEKLQKRLLGESESSEVLDNTEVQRMIDFIPSSQDATEREFSVTASLNGQL